ncbi:hypothetical protein O181_011376 [Austropuccinia psidii MF-1]|uniref:Reverse transcriptase domain-containing protein n=1 Tax=Austropuccinia psidii MF-1 TaxID=1389203 RepID=A0A9Q3BSQ2_9BASI|nr:hypothetical protein [Austropuccinia psidii MF-1]
MKLGVLRKVDHHEKVEVSTPVIITRHNNKSRMVGDLRALNTYTIPDRYLIPRIHENLTQLSRERFITSMDTLKGFHQNFLTPHARKVLRIIACCGIYEYLRMPFGIKNEPPHYQRIMNTIFPHDLSEGCRVSVTLWSLDLVVHVTSASRQRQLSHENVTQSPNPFQHYSQGSGNYIPWPKEAHAYAPAPPSRCDANTAPPSPPSPLFTLPPPTAYHPYAHIVPS